MKASPEPHHDDHQPDSDRQRPGQPAQQPGPANSGRSFWTVLSGTADSPRRARTAIRHMLPMWGLASLIPDTELMATELVTSAAEAAPAYTIGFAISPHTTQPGSRASLARSTTAQHRHPTPSQPTPAASPDPERPSPPP